MSENTLLQRFLEGNALMNSGDLLAAEKCFMAALEINAQSGEVIANLAFLRELQGDLLQAEHYYRQALILLPTTIQIYLNLGVMLVKQKRFAEAEFTYRVALQIDPYSPGSWSNYGVLLACMKREEEAEQCYRKALTTIPSSPKARLISVIFYCAKHGLKKAYLVSNHVTGRIYLVITFIFHVGKVNLCKVNLS